MTATATPPWIPVIITQGDTEECTLCGAILDLATVAQRSHDKFVWRESLAAVESLAKKLVENYEHEGEGS